MIFLADLLRPDKGERRMVLSKKNQRKIMNKLKQPYWVVLIYCGRTRTRTPDIFGVNEALYQLSYTPLITVNFLITVNY
jgi:hypothetical protein